jgi:hypothetical protein
MYPAWGNSKGIHLLIWKLRLQLEHNIKTDLREMCEGTNLALDVTQRRDFSEHSDWPLVCSKQDISGPRAEIAESV